MNKQYKCINCGIPVWENGARCKPCYHKSHKGKCFLSDKQKNNISLRMKGDKNPCFKKIYPRKIDRAGYIFLYKLEHPFANKEGYVPEHRLMVEAHIGRYLTKGEVVHHIDENKKNNDIDNLMLFKNSGFHLSWHMKMRQYTYITRPMQRIIDERWNEFEVKNEIKK